MVLKITIWNQFGTLCNLIELKLGSTKLTKIIPGTFSNNISLEKLYLECSELAENKQGTFECQVSTELLEIWLKMLRQLGHAQKCQPCLSICIFASSESVFG